MKIRIIKHPSFVLRDVLDEVDKCIVDKFHEAVRRLWTKPRAVPRGKKLGDHPAHRAWNAVSFNLPWHEEGIAGHYDEPQQS